MSWNPWEINPNNFATVSNSFTKLLRKIKLKTNLKEDFEDVVYIGNGRFALASETNRVFVFELASEQKEVILSYEELSLINTYELPAPRRKNKGFEGLCYYHFEGLRKYMALQEDNPKKVFIFDEATSKGHSDLRNLENFDSKRIDRLFKHAMSDLSGCYYDSTFEDIYILSHESSKIFVLNKFLYLKDQFEIPSIFFQYEGITINGDREIVIVSEPNGVLKLRIVDGDNLEY